MENEGKNEGKKVNPLKGISPPNEFQETVKEMGRNLATHIMFATISAKIMKARYDALIDAGFDEKQALILCKN